jgi:hypothetical protein
MRAKKQKASVGEVEGGRARRRNVFLRFALTEDHPMDDLSRNI